MSRMEGVIQKNGLPELLRKLRETAEVFVPQKSSTGVEFSEYTDGSAVEYGFLNTKLSVKRIFFPQREKLLSFEKNTVAEPPLERKRTIVFGVRPCDAASLIYMDKVFRATNSRFEDRYYLTKRENSLIVAVACKRPGRTCFCTSVGGHPAGTAGADILCHEFGDELLFEAVSEKGEAFMREHSAQFVRPYSALANEKEKQMREAEGMLVVMSLSSITERLDAMFDDAEWDRITATCLGCGACTYLCPTCHCFDITDEDNGRGKGIRVRTWDSCQYPLFTAHASGHNPRVNKKQRMRQRIMHKFSYTVHNTNDIFCVGCGRCIVHCPVNLDIRDMLKTFVS